jgi:hypothetical protein
LFASVDSQSLLLHHLVVTLNDVGLVVGLLDEAHIQAVALVSVVIYVIVLFICNYDLPSRLYLLVAISVLVIVLYLRIILLGKVEWAGLASSSSISPIIMGYSLNAVALELTLIFTMCPFFSMTVYSLCNAVLTSSSFLENMSLLSWLSRMEMKVLPKWELVFSGCSSVGAMMFFFPI